MIVGFDTFTETSANVLLEAHTPDTGGGAGWSVQVSQFSVLFATDRVQHNRNVLDRARKGDNIGDDDHDVMAMLSVGGSARIAGVCARMSTDGYTNQYEAIMQFLSTTQQDVKLFKNIAGTRTQLGPTQTITLAQNVECEFRLEIRAGTQKVYVDSVVVISQTEPDATLAGRNFAGIIMNGNNSGNAAISYFQSESVSADTTMAATLDGTGTLVADLSTGAPETMTAVMSGAGGLVAVLTTDITMAASADGQGTLVAALTTSILLAASISGQGTLVAAFPESGPSSPFMAAGLIGTGTLNAALSGGHATLRFSTYDIYIDNALVELGVLDDTSVTVSLTDTYTGSKEFGGVTVRLGLGRGPDVAALFDEAKGAGLRIYRYDAGTTLQTLIFDGIINTVDLDTSALVVGGVQIPVKILEMKIPVHMVDDDWTPLFGGAPVDFGVPLPDIFGSVPRSKCVYINRDRPNNNYDYIICRLRGATMVPAMYRSVSNSSGKKEQVSLINAIEYTIHQGDIFAGYLSARFPVEQITTSGSDHTIYADVVTNLDQAITRNPARILRTYLQEAGQTIVAASFDAAEAEYTRLGYGLDFSLTEQIQLQELAKDISLMLDSVLDRTSEGWTFATDVRPTTVDYQFAEGEAVTPTIIDISPVSLTPLLNETSEVVVKYLPDPLDPGTYLGTVKRTVSSSIHASPLELTFPWVRAWVIADRIADYKAKQIRTRDRTVTITGPRVSALPIRTLVSITSPRRRLNNVVYMIKSLQQSVLGQPQLECVAWAPDPYIYEPGPVPADPVLGTFSDFSRIPPPVITDITFPAGAPYEGVEIGPAGAMTAFITMRFVTPTGGNYAFAVVRYRRTSTTLWVPAGGPITQLGTVDVKIRNLEPQTSYDFSAQSFNQWGLTAGGE